MRFSILAALFATPLLSVGSDKPALQLVVMDPLCKELSCPCVKGFAQRDYRALGDFLSKKLGRPVEFTACETLAAGIQRTHNSVDLVIGKDSVIRSQASAQKGAFRPLARLSDRQGKTTLTGLFVVRVNSPVKGLTDLKDRKILFGPAECEEKYSAALAALQSTGVPLPYKPDTRQGCDGTVLEVAEKKADAGVISSYAIKLLEGCGAIDQGSLRTVGETLPVPFITAFAGPHLTGKDAEAVSAALMEVRNDKKLRTKLESRDGFVAIPNLK